MKTKIMITVEGGIVQHIASNTEDVEIIIVDFDNEQGEEVQGYYEPDTITNDFTEIVHSNIVEQIQNL